MNNKIFDLNDDVAVVIGGTGELGGLMAESLGNFGAKVAVVGRNAERGQSRAKAISDAGGEAKFFAADSLNADSLAETRDTIKAWAGSPASVLVNAAGGNRPEATIPPGGDFCKLPLDAWKDVFDLNLVGGSLLPCQVFAPDMIESGVGSIINIASMSGMIPLSRVVAYSAAKAAVINLTLWLSREWATTGVRVNAISPGFFPAEQNRKLLFNEDGSYTERGGQIIGHTPMARFGTAEELAGAVVWLASRKASSFVTGQNIAIDGGFASVTI
ncbi:putative oxidoreductase UxuB [Planctomycetes bacterium CA13]|uniref:Putative oxidoreductase UxuB n=1 Tax=Novipirellula herctigrandis TaxID=2527986 RepID=A0A5C5Z1A2_9BACT|nr:putative oxidoreductase UxuB [Planctomycetes bacterium CA13]